MRKTFKFSPAIIHVDRRGNEVNGRIVYNIPFQEALSLFPFTFRKNEGYFVTEEEFQNFKKNSPTDAIEFCILELNVDDVCTPQESATNNNQKQNTSVQSYNPESIREDLIPKLKELLDSNLVSCSVRTANIIKIAFTNQTTLYSDELTQKIRTKFANCGEKSEKEIRALISEYDLKQDLIGSHQTYDDIDDEMDLMPKLLNLIEQKKATCSVRTSNIIKNAVEAHNTLFKSDLSGSFKYKFAHCGRKSEEEIKNLIDEHITSDIENDGSSFISGCFIQDLLNLKPVKDDRFLASLFRLYPSDLRLSKLIEEIISNAFNSAPNLAYCQYLVLKDLILSDSKFKNIDSKKITVNTFREALEDIYKLNSAEEIKLELADLLNCVCIQDSTYKQIESIYLAQLDTIHDCDISDYQALKNLIPAAVFKNERGVGCIVGRLLATEKLTLEELGEIYGVTRERIRQIEKATTSKLLLSKTAYCWLLLEMFLSKQSEYLKKSLAIKSGIIHKDQVEELFESFPSWVRNLLRIKDGYQRSLSAVSTRRNDFFVLDNFFEYYESKIENSAWFKHICEVLSLSHTTNAEIKSLAPFLSEEAITFFKSNKQTLSIEKSIEDICASVVNFHGYPMKMEEVYSKYSDEVRDPRDMRTVANIIMDSEQFLIMGRGTYGTYDILPFKGDVVKMIRDLSFSHLSSNLEKKYISAADLHKILSTSVAIDKLSRYAIYGILQDDNRFYCHRYGLKIGLSSNFSESDLVAFGKILTNSLLKYGPLSVKDMQIQANQIGDYHDQTIVTELARSNHIVRLERGLYGLIGKHISILDLACAEYISLFYLQKKNRTIHFILDKIEKFHKKLEYETLLDYLRKNSVSIEVSDDFMKIVSPIELSSWTPSFRAIPNLSEIQSRIREIHRELTLQGDQEDEGLNSSAIIKELGF